MKLFPASLVLSLGLLLNAGCAVSQSARIQEKSVVFRSLTPGQQQQVLAGRVNVGFTSDMVYLALGKPAEVKAAGNSAAQGEEWVYRRVYSRFVPGTGISTTGTSPVYDSTGMIQGGPYDQAVKLGSEADSLEVFFRAGKVVLVKRVVARVG